MKTTQTANELTIREAPGCLWVFGLFFALVGGFLAYGALGGFSNWNEAPFWQLALTFFMGAVAVGVGIWLIYQAPVSKVIIDRIEDKVLLSRYGLFGKRQTVYRFSEIEHFCLIEDKDTDDCPIWSVGLKLNNGETIKITSHPRHSEEYERKCIFEINEFMRKQMPSYKNDLIE